jgi:hypothetical protein
LIFHAQGGYYGDGWEAKKGPVDIKDLRYWEGEVKPRRPAKSNWTKVQLTPGTQPIKVAAMFKKALRGLIF